MDHAGAARPATGFLRPKCATDVAGRENSPRALPPRRGQARGQLLLAGDEQIDPLSQPFERERALGPQLRRSEKERDGQRSSSRKSIAACSSGNCSKKS